MLCVASHRLDPSCLKQHTAGLANFGSMSELTNLRLHVSCENPLAWLIKLTNLGHRMSLHRLDPNHLHLYIALTFDLFHIENHNFIFLQCFVWRHWLVPDCVIFLIFFFSYTDVYLQWWTKTSQMYWFMYYTCKPELHRLSCHILTKYISCNLKQILSRPKNGSSWGE